MPFSNQQTGTFGEKLAQNFLIDKGYRILFKNYYTRSGEIDIIARKQSKISFIEVKTRIGKDKGMPYEAVRYFKITHLKRAIKSFLLKNGFDGYKLSLDVISVILDENMNLVKIDYFENVDQPDCY